MTDETIEIVDPLTELRNANSELVNQIHAEGMGLDSQVGIHLRLDTLIDLLLPPGTPFRHLWELESERRFNGLLTEAVSQARQAKLTQGVDKVKLESV